jgi:multiple sugar transport system ATP-binding protein
LPQSGRISCGWATGSPVRLQGRGFITEELQDHNEIFVDVGSGARVAGHAARGERVARNEAVTISVDPDHLLLFPADVPGEGAL